MEIDNETEQLALAFKPVAEHVIGDEVTDEAYYGLAVQKGIEQMVADIIPQKEAFLWQTIVDVLKRDPEDFATFMKETLVEGKGNPSDWNRYIK